jgi:hypothetical protein
MCYGYLDILTIVPVEEITTLGIPYVKGWHIDHITQEDEPKLEMFWSYFES